MKRKIAALLLCAFLLCGAAPAAPAEPEASGVNAAAVLTDNMLDTVDPMGLPESDPVDDSYFDDVVFVGDSISLKLYYYVKAQRQKDESFLGKAEFLTAGSLSSANALWEVSDKSVHPTYQGKKMRVEDAIAKMSGINKVYIMLGMNDVGGYGATRSIENIQELITRIKAKSPHVEIYLQSATPRIKGYESAKPNNSSLFDYNLLLYGLARREGYHFVDVAHVMRNENGELKDEYCSDKGSMGIHFTDEGCAVWVDFLRTHTTEG